MIGIFELLLLLIVAPVSVGAVICCVGWWATVKPRLQHRERMFELNERAKLTAVEVTARQLELTRDTRGLVS